MYLDDSALLQCRIGLISEVIVIGIYIDQHRQSYALWKGHDQTSHSTTCTAGQFSLAHLAGRAGPKKCARLNIALLKGLSTNKFLYLTLKIH